MTAEFSDNVFRLRAARLETRIDSIADRVSEGGTDHALHDADKSAKLANMDRDLLDAKISTVEARTDAKFAELKGEIATGQARLETMFAELRKDLAEQQGSANTALSDFQGEVRTAQATLSGEISTLKAAVDAKPGKFDVWGGLLALFVAFVAILAFGGDRLSTGIGLADQRQEQLERDREQDNSATQINSKLDKLLLNSQ